MKNPVAQSIADFLKHFSPFDSLDNTDLLNIAENSKILYLDKNQDE